MARIYHETRSLFEIKLPELRIKASFSFWLTNSGCHGDRGEWVGRWPREARLCGRWEFNFHVSMLTAFLWRGLAIGCCPSWCWVWNEDSECVLPLSRQTWLCLYLLRLGFGSKITTSVFLLSLGTKAKCKTAVSPRPRHLARCLPSPHPAFLWYV